MLFRVDSNRTLGLGHLSRCIQLANSLKRKKINSCFLIKKNNIAISYIKNSGYDFVIIPTNTNDIHEIKKIKRLKANSKIDLIFIDLRKTKSQKYFKALKKIAKIVVIDNYENASLNADLIIWSWSMLKELKRKIPQNSYKKILVGPDYMILGKIPTSRIEKKNSKTILISMGGSDKYNLTLKLVRELKKSHLKVKFQIVIGKFFQDVKNIEKEIENDRRFSLEKKIDNLIPLMMNSKIGIFTFGITIYEALFAGLPSIVLAHSLQNDIYAKLLAKNECVDYIGYYKKINFHNIPNKILNLIENGNKMNQMSKNGKKIVDGKGVSRIVNKLERLIEMS